MYQIQWEIQTQALSTHIFVGSPIVVFAENSPQLDTSFYNKL